MNIKYVILENRFIDYNHIELCRQTEQRRAEVSYLNLPLNPLYFYTQYINFEVFIAFKPLVRYKIFNVHMHFPFEHDCTIYQISIHIKTTKSTNNKLRNINCAAVCTYAQQINAIKSNTK